MWNRLASQPLIICSAVLLLTAEPVRAAERPLQDLVAHCFDAGGVCAGLESDSPDRDGQATAVGPSRRSGKFDALIASYVATSTADVALSMYHIRRGTGRERGFGAWWQDRPVPFAISKGAMIAASVLIFQNIHETRPKTALILGLVATAVESSLVARNAWLMSNHR
jgi:hypothetical protein